MTSKVRDLSRFTDGQERGEGDFPFAKKIENHTPGPYEEYRGSATAPRTIRHSRNRLYFDNCFLPFFIQESFLLQLEKPNGHQTTNSIYTLDPQTNISTLKQRKFKR